MLKNSMIAINPASELEHHYVTNRLKCETLQKNGISAPFLYGAGLRIERRIAGK